MDTLSTPHYTEDSGTGHSIYADLDQVSCPSSSEPSSPEGEMRCGLPSPCDVNPYLPPLDHSPYFPDKTLHCLTAWPFPPPPELDPHMEFDSVRRKLNFDDCRDGVKEPSDKIKQEMYTDAFSPACGKKMTQELPNVYHSSVVKQESYESKHLSTLQTVCQEGLVQRVTDTGLVVRLENGFEYDIDMADLTSVVSANGEHTSSEVSTSSDYNNNCLPASVYGYQNMDSGYYSCEQKATGQCYTLHGSCAQEQQGTDHNGYVIHDRRCPAPIEGDDLYRCHSGRRRTATTRTERLWEFILRLLGDPQHNPRLIEWVEREDGTFRLNNSKAIAHMWGMRKNNEQMTYEKLSRALRYYYHRKILEPVLGKKLVYRFGPKATQVWARYTYRSQHRSRLP